MKGLKIGVDSHAGLEGRGALRRRYAESRPKTVLRSATASNQSRRPPTSDVFAVSASLRGAERPWYCPVFPEPEVPSPPFRSDAARQYLDVWVDLVDDPTLNWAWDVVQGILKVYAECGDATQSALWADWFLASGGSDAEAYLGVHGALQEFLHACPDEHADDQLRVLGEAVRIGLGLPAYPENASKRGPDRRRTPARPVPRLTLVVDNTGRKTPR